MIPLPQRGRVWLTTGDKRLKRKASRLQKNALEMQARVFSHGTKLRR